MTRDETEQLIHDVFRARLAGRLDELVGYLAPDVTLRFPGTSSNEILARTSGSRDSVREHLAALLREWRWTDIDVMSIVIEGDRAVVHAKQFVVHTPSGTPSASEVVDLITFRDGQITEFVEFVDTALVASMAHVAA